MKDPGRLRKQIQKRNMIVTESPLVGRHPEAEKAEGVPIAACPETKAMIDLSHLRRLFHKITLLVTGSLPVGHHPEVEEMIGGIELSLL